jgi:hypothetical protein
MNSWQRRTGLPALSLPDEETALPANIFPQTFRDGLLSLN